VDIIHLHSAANQNRAEKNRITFFADDFKALQFVRFPRPHSFLLDLIKPLQPMFAILRGVLQQKESYGGHGSGDVADVPLAALPDRAKVRGVFARIVTFAGTQLLELDGDRRR
jgi:hypothetical protein